MGMADNIYKCEKTKESMTKKEEFKVTPYEAEGQIDYGKLINEFGVSKLDNKLIEILKKYTKDLHLFIRRGVFFAHRDLN